MLLAAGAVSAGGCCRSTTIINTIEKEGRAPIDMPEIDRAEAGKPQTIMILGSDGRYGDKKAGLKPRSDTIILVRLDPDKEAISVMSMPRDLKVDIPGYGDDRINAAYSNGGPRLTLKTVKKLLSAPGEPFKINHVIEVDFSGFRQVVNYLGCVYVDIDRHYFNDNSGGRDYATIDVKPGYQKIYGQDALDYVRYRHTDNDLVRGARQQDFLRQVRNAAGARRLLGYRRRRQLARIFARYTRHRQGAAAQEGHLLAAQARPLHGRKPVREVRFRVDLTDDPVYLTASEDKLDETANEFLNAAGVRRSRARTSRASTADREPRPRRKKGKRNRAADVPGLEVAEARGREPGDRRRAARAVPVLLPDAAHRGARYAGTEPRIYRIQDELGKQRRAYRLVVSMGAAASTTGSRA